MDFDNLDDDDIKLALGTLLLRTLSAEKRLHELTEEEPVKLRLRLHRPPPLDAHQGPPEEGPPAA